MIEDLIQAIAQILAIVLVLSVHEFAHAYVAYRCGDTTAKQAGRMTLNPLKHFDAVGLVAFCLTRFGWAKPVPINPYNFKNRRKGYLWTSAAGVMINYITALLVYPILLLIITYAKVSYWNIFLYAFFYYTYSCSLSFCVFNLLPLYPLDGFRIVEAIDNKHGQAYTFLKRHSSKILIGLIAIHFLSRYFSVLAYVDLLGFAMNHVIGVLAKPIEWIGKLIFEFLKA